MPEFPHFFQLSRQIRRDRRIALTGLLDFIADADEDGDGVRGEVGRESLRRLGQQVLKGNFESI